LLRHASPLRKPQRSTEVSGWRRRKRIERTIGGPDKVPWNVPLMRRCSVRSGSYIAARPQQQTPFSFSNSESTDALTLFSIGGRPCSPFREMYPRNASAELRRRDSATFSSPLGMWKPEENPGAEDREAQTGLRKNSDELRRNR